MVLWGEAQKAEAKPPPCALPKKLDILLCPEIRVLAMPQFRQDGSTCTA
jgi:hypothetical protein